MSQRFYIDSRFRESGSASDFRWNLISPLELHDGAMGYIDSFCCSNVFNSVVAGHNDSIYFRQTQGLTKFDKRLHIPPGQYTAASLAVAVQALLNEYALQGCSYTVAAVSGGTQLILDADIESNFTARILSTVELEGAFEDWGYGNSYYMEPHLFKNILEFSDGGDFIGAGELSRRDPEDAGELLGSCWESQTARNAFFPSRGTS